MSQKRYNRIKEVLARKGKTNKDFAAEMGISHITVSRWASNARQPDIETLYKIAEALHISPCDLLEGGSEVKTPDET